jgi:hypothetical protein
VEWHLSARELCAPMAKVEDLPLMCVAVIWNDAAHEVDDVKLVLAVRGLLAALLSPAPP